MSDRSSSTDPQKDCRTGKGVRVCADESRPAAGADLTSSLTVRHTERKAAGPVAHAGTGGAARLRRALAWVCFVVPIMTAGYLIGLFLAVAATRPR